MSTDPPLLSLMEAVPMPLALIARDARILGLNPPALELLGPGVGRHYMTVLRQPGLLDCVETALSGGREAQTNYQHRTLAREALFLVRAAPVETGSGQGVLLSFEDRSDLEQAGQMRRDFVANVSHELKTPLTAVLGFIETLRGPARNDPAARDRFLMTMERETQRMNRLVSDLLSLSRVEATARLRPAGSVALDELVGSVMAGLRPVADTHGVTITVEKDPEDGPFTVPGDADQLEQVMVNLLENAMKYGASGGKVILRLRRVARDVALRGPGVEIEVIDYGDGFDPIHIPRLTERFYRVDSHRSRSKGGTGLGLAIVKHIVNRHRGRLRIETAPGQGARFCVLLPTT